MSKLKRIGHFHVGDLQEGQRIIVNGKPAMFTGEDHGEISYIQDGIEDVLCVGLFHIEVGNENRSDGTEFCPECGGYYLAHTH